MNPPPKSYAQWGDDLLVLQHFGVNYRGVFLEAGANDPKHLSQTYLLEQHGWSGVLVEPIPACCEALRRERPRSQVFQNALGAPDQQGVLRLRVPDGATELTHALPSGEADRHRDRCARVAEIALRRLAPTARDQVIEAPFITLDEVLRRANITQLDLLSLDLEGFELPALQGLDLQRLRPRLIILEDRLENLGRHWHLCRRGYRLVKRNGSNNWYMPVETRYPVTLSQRLRLVRKLYLSLPLRRCRDVLRAQRPARPPRVVIAIPKGGLGNQMFIYAAARALALRTGRQLYLDTVRGYTHDSFQRVYRLDQFPIAAESMPEDWRVAPTLKHPRHKLVRGLNKLLPRKQRSYLAQVWSAGPEQLTTLRPRRQQVTLLGYWQDEAFFADYAAIIRRELAPPPPADASQHQRGTEFAAAETVFVHVRRHQYRHLLGSDYYQQAIDWLREEHPNAHFAIFGDDPDWARQQLDFKDASLDWVSGNDEITDLWLMTQCRHAIVANSSFSWWGAWLNQMSGPRSVVFPAQPGWNLVPAQGWLRQSHEPTR